MRRNFAIVVLLALVGYMSRADIQRSDQTNYQWDPMNLKAQFTKLTANIDYGEKSKARQKLNALEALLDNCGENTRQRQFNLLISSPGSSRTNSFDEWLAEAFFERLLRANDTNALQRLLIANCPKGVGSLTLEYDLAVNKQCVGMSILVNAYKAAATNSYSSFLLLDCLDRAFPKIREQHKLDTDFVNECERWIAANQERCVVNPDYWYSPSSYRSGKENVGLFLLSK